MTISVVQTAKGAGTSLSFASATTAGNCVIVVVLDSNISAPSVTGITFGGVALSALATATSTSSIKALATVWALPGAASGTAIAVTESNGNDPVIIAYEVAGLAASSVLDKTHTGTGTAASWSSGSTATTTQAVEAWIGAACIVNTAPTGPGAPWSNISQASGTTDGIAGSQVTSSTGTATYSGSGGGSNGWAAVVVTLLPASGAVTSSGGLTAAPAAMSGTATVPITSSGGLTAAPAALSGTGILPVPVTSSGSLTAAAAALSGTGAMLVTASGGLKTAPAAMSGTGSVLVPQLIVSLASQAGTDDYGTSFPQGVFASAGLIQGPQIVADNTTGQILIYSGTPAAGNLIASASAMAGSDGFGNSFQAGLTVYDTANSTWAQMDSGALNFANGATIGNAVAGLLNIDNNGVAGIIVNSNTDEIELNASQVSADGNSLTGLFGMLDPSGYPLSSSATLTAVIATLNSTIQRLQNAGVFQ